MNTFIRLFLWAIFFFIMVDCICAALTMASIIANLFGLLLIIVVIWVSIESKFFTKPIKFKKDKKQ